ncbi:hypothetical protein K227x_32350 [Rubripirellula lacrimiformis]|uniref:Transposase IS110-like N-terminal domain-containing protein n=1 Tax=Rubripirellula lacrimiformis TaxID=1930273 RepID=A0A517NCR1_9BACT|nr:transposase [Rubripirellula lacrimiformis]QDT04838.1 hypothetical protein K227x_32350 [Rubripirellula lacrimiformis]
MNSTTLSTSTKARNRFNSSQADSTSLRLVNVAFDVGSDSLHWAMELPGLILSDQCENTSGEIRKTLRHIRDEAAEHGYDEVRVICESTGVYHRRLLQLTTSMAMRTCLVHGEAVAKFRAIQFGDHGKTDARDPRAVLTVPGQKASVCVMRKILKMFYGWYNSGQAFDRSRVFVMASQHKKAA